MKRNVIIILVWNDYINTKATIDSILLSEEVDYDILIVDNNSSDDSIMQLKKTYKDCRKIQYLINDQNWGYAEGNNIALRYCYNLGYQNFYVLNNDLIFNNRELIKDLERLLNSDPSIGIIAPIIWNKQNDGSFKKGTIETNSRLYNQMLSDNNVYLGKLTEQLYQVSTVSGCFIVLTRECLKRCDGFEKQFFMYAEEDDLCIRTSLNGLKVVRIVKDYGVKHLGGVLNFLSIKDWKRAIGNRNKMLILRNFRMSLKVKYALIILVMTLQRSLLLISKLKIRSSIIIFLSYFEGVICLVNSKKLLKTDTLFERGKKLPNCKSIYSIKAL